MNTMSFHENSFGSKKKLRQLSITDLFQPAQKKRCASNKSDQTSSDDIKMENRAGDGPQKVSSEQKCSEASNISQEFSSEEKTQQSNDHIERPQVKVDADANDKLSQGSQDLMEAIIAERSERCRKFLKQNIVEEDDAVSNSSVEMPSKSVPATPANKIKDDDTLLIYDSPDMFADTFPTPDFDLGIDSQPPDEDNSVKWKGMNKEDLKTAPDCVAPLPKLKQTKYHKILFDTDYFDIGPPPPSHGTYVDAWDSVHVKLPCSPKNLFPKSDRKGLSNRWELIENALLDDFSTVKKLETAIKSYNVRLNQPFKALDALVNDVFTESERSVFYKKTLPGMIELALSLPSLITQPIPLLTAQRSRCLTLSQQQCACLLANAFFCTFPRRNSSNPDSEYANYPTINFNRLLIGKGSCRPIGHHVEKLKTILHYFERVVNDMPSGVVTFERRALKDFPVWSKSPSKLQGVHVTSEGFIEDDGAGMMRLDFANKFVGGGVLSSGMVQEEILFVIFPELIVSRLFSEVMDDNECVFVTGAERFSNYTGYSNQFKYAGDHVDSNTRDTWRRKISYFAALDATYFSQPRNQYKAGSVRRELNKLYCGFQDAVNPDYAPAIATGNWGCGAFRGNPVFKALLQMMAAAVVCRDVCYFTFGDSALMETIHDMHRFVTSQDLGVDDLWKLLCQYNERRVIPLGQKMLPEDDDIFEFIKETVCCYDASTDDEEC